MPGLVAHPSKAIIPENVQAGKRPAGRESVGCVSGFFAEAIPSPCSPWGPKEKQGRDRAASALPPHKEEKGVLTVYNSLPQKQ